MSGADYLLDTNVVIGFLGGRKWAKAFVLEKLSSGATFAVSQITRMELLGFSELTPREEELVGQFLSGVQILPLSEAVERRAIQVRRAERIKLPDAIIVATALESGRTLITCDHQLAHLTIAGLSVHTPDP